MKHREICIAILLSITFVFSSHAQQDDFPVLKGPYLSQEPSRMTPEAFAAGIISTDAHEFSCCFSPDGNEFYFNRRYAGLNQTVIMFNKIVGGIWTEPEVASFTENEFTFEPFVTFDNQRLYFQCGRLVDGAHCRCLRCML